MNLTHTYPKNTVSARAWMWAAIIVFFFAALAFPSLQGAFRPVDFQNGTATIAAQPAPQVMPVPTAPDRVVVDAPRIQSTPAPAAAQPVPQPVATPPGSPERP